jgi:hypothetical protein
MLPEDGPVRLKHVVNIYILMTCEHFNKHLSEQNVNWCHKKASINIVAL